MIRTDSLTLDDATRISPLPGRSIIHLDAPPTMSDLGLLHLPESAQKKSDKDILWPGTVVKISPRKESHPDYQPEQVGDGDRVLVALMLDDVGRDIIITLNTRIWAGLPKPCSTCGGHGRFNHPLCEGCDMVQDLNDD